jgi:hypothetical protein
MEDQLIPKTNAKRVPAKKVSRVKAKASPKRKTTAKKAANPRSKKR